MENFFKVIKYKFLIYEFHFKCIILILIETRKY